MKRWIFAAAASATMAMPGVALAQPPTLRHMTVYHRWYHKVVRDFGFRAAGCELGRTCHQPVTDAAVVKSLGVLQRMYTPVHPDPVAHIAATYTSAVTSTYTPAASSSGGYAIPSSIVQCESGGNYSAVNPSSGAGGAYQILPSTWQAYGGQGLPQNASPAEQGRIAAKIYAGGAGRNQWSC